jgi:hypothetical protein
VGGRRKRRTSRGRNDGENKGACPLFSAERTVELITKADKLGKEAVLQALAQLTEEFTRCTFGDSEQKKMQMVSDKTDE